MAFMLQREATTWSAETVVDAAIDALSANLGPSLDAIYSMLAAADAAAGRTIDYSAPRPGSTDADPAGDYYPGGASTFLRYPAVEVALPDLRMTGFDIAMQEGDATENLIVCIWEESARRDKLFRKLTRLAAATYDVLLAPSSLLLLAGATVTRVDARWRFNPQMNERDEITSAALLVFELGSLRTRP